jgi:long-chain acyl-CoA synthetase
VSRPTTYRPLTVADGIRASAGRTPRAVAVREGERALRYEELRDRMHRVGHAALGGFGLSPGDHVAILAPNRLEYVELVCGLAGVGIAPATVSPRSSHEETRHVVADADARLLFADPSLELLARAVGDELGIPVVVLDEGYEALLATAAASRPAVEPEEWDTMVVHYTSGTTGEPKGVLVPHRSRTLNYLAMAAEYGCYGPRDQALAVAPLYGGAGLSFALAGLFLGGQTTILPRFDPEPVLESLQTGELTSVFLVPTHFHALFSLGDDRVARAGHGRFKTVISNAAPLSQAMKERIVAAWGPDRLFECYGSTEGGIVSNLPPADQLRKPGSVGLPFPATEVRLLDDDGHAVEVGEVGELYSRSPYLFSGYHNRPEATAATLRDGWFTAGDLARHDEEGYLYLVDRKGDKIITGGFNVFPREVEEVLMRHPGVAEAAVYGLPDERWGEAIHAAVTVEGRAPSTEELRAFCAERLSGYKVPKQVEVIDALPRNAAGKVMRRSLRAAGAPGAG